MEKLLIVAALVCQPGERLIDLTGKLPRGLQFMDIVVSVEPFYARLYIYQLGFPDSFQQCYRRGLSRKAYPRRRAVTTRSWRPSHQRLRARRVPCVCLRATAERKGAWKRYHRQSVRFLARSKVMLVRCLEQYRRVCRPASRIELSWYSRPIE